MTKETKRSWIRIEEAEEAGEEEEVHKIEAKDWRSLRSLGTRESLWVAPSFCFCFCVVCKPCSDWPAWRKSLRCLRRTLLMGSPAGLRRTNWIIWQLVGLFFFFSRQLNREKKLQWPHTGSVWTIEIQGTKDSPYESGVFGLEIWIPERCAEELFWLNWICWKERSESPLSFFCLCHVAAADTLLNHQRSSSQAQCTIRILTMRAEYAWTFWSHCQRLSALCFFLFVLHFFWILLLTWCKRVPGSLL